MKNTPGGIGGLAGASEIAGIHFHLIHAISPGYGYTGIIIATLGSLNAIGVAAAALFIGLVDTGSQTVSCALGVPAYLGDVLQATLLLVTLGRWLDARAQVEGSRALNELLARAPAEASLISADGAETRVPVEQLKVSDQIQVRPGENFAVDCHTCSFGWG